jgi:hypothetical protein
MNIVVLVSQIPVHEAATASSLRTTTRFAEPPACFEVML